MSKYVVDGSDNDPMDPEVKKRILFYIFTGVIILLAGLLIYALLPKSGSMDNPYRKTDTGFHMNHNSHIAEGEILDVTPTPLPNYDEAADESHEEEFKAGLSAPTEEMLGYPNQSVLMGYARCENTYVGTDNTTAEFALYSDGKTDNFINHLDQTFMATCIDHGLEPPHDGHSHGRTKAFDGNSVGKGQGDEWWYELSDYGYTATLTKTETEPGLLIYDWSVVINFGYGEYHEETQRMRLHITYESDERDLIKTQQTD